MNQKNIPQAASINTDTIKLSLAQQDIYFDQLHQADSPHYTVGGYLPFKEASISGLVQAHRLLISNEQVFGIRIAQNDQGVCQYFSSQRNVELPIIHFSDQQNPQQAALNWSNQQCQQTLTLANSELFQCALLVLSDSEVWYVMIAHHIIMDGLGFVNWAEQLMYYYHQTRTNSGQETIIQTTPWDEIVASDLLYLSSKKYPKDRQFWLDQLGQLPEPLLTKRHQYRFNNSAKTPSHREQLAIDATRYQRWHAGAKQGNIGIQSLFLAIITLYFSRITERPTLNIGSATHNRKSHSQKQMMGTFTAVNPVAVTVDMQQTFANMAQAISDSQKASYRYGRYPHGHLLRDLGGNGQDGGLFDIQFNYVSLLTEGKINGFDVPIHRLCHGHETVPFVFNLVERSDLTPAVIELDINLAYFEPGEGKLLLDRLLYMVEQVVQNPSLMVSQIELLPAEEKTKLTQQWQRAMMAEQHSGNCIVGLFESQAANQPNAIALVCDQTTLDYQTLNHKANQLAHYLLAQLAAKGCKPGALIGLSLPRTEQLVITILAILKAGAAYVPLDPEYPESRLNDIIIDSVLSLVITEQAIAKKIDFAAHVLCLDNVEHQLQQQNGAINPAIKRLDKLAYVIYTSGSTGKPKGVMVGHSAIANHISSINAEYQMQPSDKVLLFASMSFDPSIEQLFTTLCSGATALLLDHSKVNGEALFEFITSHGITVADLPPSYFEQLTKIPQWADYIRHSNLRMMLLGGEALNRSIVHQWRDNQLFNHCELINAYGPTEATITATYCRLSTVDRDYTPIGKLPQGRTAYVLGRNLTLLPIGVVGELYLGGPMLADGYLNQPALSQQAFIDDPFGQPNNGQAARLYRTGDLVRWLASGELDFVGRMDEQVKIHGFRIELGEIEQQLNQLIGVDGSLVISNSDHLTAYVKSTSAVCPNQLKQQLAERLPRHMLPSTIIVVAQWPLAPTGKIDKQALLKPGPALSQHALSQQDYQAPSTTTEHALVAIWSELLNIEANRISTNANFFALGGHSLLAIDAVRAIKQALGHELSITALFNKSDIRQLANIIDAGSKTVAHQEIAPVARQQQGLTLSYSQQRLWFVDQLVGSSAQYNMPLAFDIQGDFSLSILEQVLQQIVNRHEPLRTVFAAVDGQDPTQIIQQDVTITIESHDLTTSPEPQQQLTKLLLADSQRPFDLSSDLMVRAGFIRLAEQHGVLSFNFHHIACDGISLAIVFNELMLGYKYGYGTLTSASPTSLSDLYPPLPLQFADFAAWQKNRPLGPQKAYWLKQLADLPKVHSITLDHQRPAIKQHQAKQITTSLSKAISERLQQLAKQQQITLFMLLHGTLALLLSRHSNTNDIVIGTPVANRTHDDLTNLVGFFVNTLVLRINTKHPSLNDYFEHVKTVNLEAQRHQDMPFELLVEQCRVNRNNGFNPLFQILFSLDSDKTVGFELPAATITPIINDLPLVKFDLDITATLTAEGLSLTWLYDTALFSHSHIEQMSRHWQQLLGNLAEQFALSNTDCALSALTMLNQAETKYLLSGLNPPCAATSNNDTLLPIFEQHAAHNPQQIALYADTEQLSFKQLNDQANQLAHLLLADGVNQQSLVGLCLESSPLLVVAILAIFKAGAAYVPIDVDYPDSRKALIYQDTGLTLLLSHSVLAQSLATTDTIAIWSLDNLNLNNQPSRDLNHPINNAVPASRGALAYVIYTSGSTGQPKGVMVEHRQLANLGEQMTQWPLGDKSRPWGLTANVVFDASLQALAQLLMGRPIALVPPALKLQPQQLASWLQQHHVAVMDCTPSLVQLWFNEGIAEVLPTLVIGGEPIEPSLWQQLRQWQTSERLAFNVYGPTECCVNSTYCQINGDQPTIGTGLGNVQTLVLNADRQLTPFGAVGELYIGGLGVAKGYLNQPQLTQARFIDNPFATPFTTEANGPQRLYQTGDLVRFDSDGKLIFCGRIDQQIKLRGYRIEPGEIEYQLSQIAGVNGALVLLNPAQQLIAYVLIDSANPVSEAQLIAATQAKLPKYMVPSGFLSLARWPLTANGKIDHTALAQLSLNLGQHSDEYQRPVNQSQQQLQAIWSELLGIDQRSISINANFFALGGHSLLATRLLSRIRQTFAVAMPLSQLFEHTTIATISEQLQQQQKVAMPAITPVDRNQPLLLSYAQQRLWFIDQLEGNSAQYNMIGVFELKGGLDKTAFSHALAALIERHEILRTNFALLDGNPVAVVNQHQQLALIEHHYHEAEQSLEQQFEQLVEQQVNHCFDLTCEPLIQFHLCSADQGVFQGSGGQANAKQLLLINAHHIVLDGWSVGIMFKQLSHLYANARSTSDRTTNSNTEVNNSPACQYLDYAQWQRQWLQGEVLEQQLAFWRKRLEGIPQVHNLPLDKPRPSLQTFTGATEVCFIDEQQTLALNTLAKNHQATLFMLLQSAFAVLIGRYSNETDIVVGTPVAGRNHPDLESLLGFFVNTLVLRTDLTAAPSFSQLLAANRQAIIDAYNHQNMPFEMLVEAISPQRSLSASPVFQILFSLQNQQQHPLNLAGLEVTERTPSQSQIKFDLELDISHSEQGLKLQWHYNTELFFADTIKRMAANFAQLLASIVAEPKASIDALPLLSEAENQRLLSQFGVRPMTLSPRFAGTELLSIHQRFEQQAQRTPHGLAVALNEQQLSYGQLNAQANQLAHHLLATDVKPGDNVAIFLHRSPQLMVAIMAILKTGAAYVPVDPAYPLARIRYLLQDCAAKVVISQQALAGDIAAEAITNVAQVLMADDPSLAHFSQDNPALKLPRNSLAYLIYTSGSTGQPKGAMISQHNVLNLLSWYITQYQLDHTDRVLVFSATSFDLTQKNLLAPLLVGASLHFATTKQYDPQQIVEVIGRDKISLTNCAPSACYPLLDIDQPFDYQRLNSLRYLLLGGEPIDISRFNPWLKQGKVTLVNMYGPTECTDIACAYTLVDSVDDNAILPIGKPNRNVLLYVLKPSVLKPSVSKPDCQQNILLPQGAVGELCIGGAGVSCGYFNQAQLTAEKFVTNPFNPGEQTQSTMYKTGDLVRWLPTGDLEFIGRIDNQVKIRGLRIELGEVEACLNALDEVKQAVVLASDNRLVAYLVLNSQQSQSQSQIQQSVQQQIQQQLMRQLPDYMVPSAFVLLAAMPLTPNSKIDRKALPALYQPSQNDYQAPQTELEHQLLQLWCQLLKHNADTLSSNANFFELGGHSLLVSQLIYQAQQQYQLAIEVADVFLAPTIAQLAHRLSTNANPLLSMTQQPSDDQPFGLSYAQYRIWFVEKMQPGSNQNNMTAGFKLSGHIDENHLERSYQLLIERHDILRSCFSQNQEQPQQHIAPQLPFKLDVHHLEHLSDTLKTTQARELVHNHNTKPFDISAAGLISGLLIKLDSQQYLLHTNIHHLVCDGWSQMQCFSELFALYEQLNQGLEIALNPLPHSYRDYVLWQQAFLASEQADQQRQFWRQYLADCNEQLILPQEVDPSAAKSPTTSASNEMADEFSLDQIIDLKVRDTLVTLANAHQGSLFNVLQSTFTLLLGRLTAMNDLTIGIAVSGRNLAGSENLVGNFLNNLPVRSQLALAQTFAQHLKQEISNVSQVLAHQQLPFEQIVEQASLDRAPLHRGFNQGSQTHSTPLFQVFFNMLSLPQLPVSEQTTDKSPVKSFHYESDFTAPIDSKFKLSIYLADTPQGIKIHCSYDKKRLTHNNIKLLLTQYSFLLQQIAADPHKPCHQYSLRPPIEGAVTLPALSDPLDQTSPDFISTSEKFAQMARQYPNNVALHFNHQTISYQQLDALASHYAAELILAGVLAGDVVAIFAQRSPALVIATLAVGKAGAAFMMLSRQAPQPRVIEQLSIVAPKVIICLEQAKLPYPLPQKQLNVCVEPTGPLSQTTAVSVKANDLAYIAFTSGTEGKPKAVMGRQSSLTAFMPWMAQHFKLTTHDRFALLSGLVHDPLQRDIFTPLCLGASLYIPPSDIATPQWLDQHQISVLHLTPSLGEQLMLLSDTTLPWLRIGFFVGESLLCEQVNRFKKIAPQLSVINLYGSTETGRSVAYFETYPNMAEQIVPLGSGMPGCALMVLNSALAPCGYGEIGQLGIRSAHLSLGYYAEPSLTAQRFVPNPQSQSLQGDLNAVDNDIIYLTGDLGRYRADGQVDYLGRADTQVKIRGFRVELAQISNCLEKHPLVQQCAILPVKDGNSSNLIAFLTLNDTGLDKTDLDKTNDSSEILYHYLSQQLPDYMLPSAIQIVAQLPLTENGKIDRKALSAIALAPVQRHKQIVPPSNAIESQLLTLYQAVFAQTSRPVAEFGITDDFFALGGHSLLALRLLMRVKQHFALDIDFAAFFADSTIQSVAEMISKNNEISRVLNHTSNKKNTITL